MFDIEPLDIPARRCKVMEIHQDLLLSMFQGLDGQQCLKIEGIPADARAVGMWADDLSGHVRLLVESDEFSLVGAGEPYPKLSPLVKVVKPGWRDRAPLL